jgi:hypothetical protein
LRSRKCGYASFACLLFLALSAEAATYRRMSLDELVQSSDYVIYGRVVASHVQWDPTTQTIWTRTELLVLDGPKGQAATSIAVTEPGGILDGRGELYPGVPQFGPGEEVVLFLYRAPGNRLRVTGLLQGVYPVITDRQTGERTAQPAVPHRQVVYEEGSPYAPKAAPLTAGAEKLSSFLYAIRQKALMR